MQVWIPVYQCWKLFIRFINGAAPNSYIATDVDGTDISIRKEGKNIYLRVDGTGSATRTISLSDANSTQTQMWALIRTEGAESALNMAGLRTGGIDDVGYMAELSYDLTPDREFSATAASVPSGPQTQR